jgi:parallel beta-helix repeat protein
VDPVGFPVFGTLTAALAAASAGANQNGRVTIVTSGRFREAVLITGASGNVSLEAAPGVEATIDAVASGNPGGGNAARQASPGITVNAPADRHITLRNLVVRNWSEGILVLGTSRVLIENCRVEQNLNYGIYVQGTAKVAIEDCSVAATGFRAGSAGNSPSVVPPNPGTGIQFADQSSGLVCRSTIVGNFAAGINNATGKKKSIASRDNCLFDNNPDTARMDD